MVQAFFPLIDGITGVLLAGLEVIKGYFTMKITEYNLRIRKNASEEESTLKQPLGFYYQEEEENE